MTQLILHLYQYAEIYTILLTWIVVPLFFLTVFIFFSKHYGWFIPHSEEIVANEAKVEGGAHGSN